MGLALSMEDSHRSATMSVASLCLGARVIYKSCPFHDKSAECFEWWIRVPVLLSLFYYNAVPFCQQCSGEFLNDLA